MIKKKLRKSLYKFGKYAHIQLFLTLCSWPLLVSWGIPFSLASIIGNFIFAPILSLFLLFASLIFFCELLSINNAMFIMGLEYITNCWCYLLSLGSRSWLIAFPESPLLFLCMVPLCAFLILHYKKLLSISKNSIALSLLAIATAFISHAFFTPHNFINIIECGNSHLILKQENNTVTLIDKKALSGVTSPEVWVRAVLMPFLVKNGIANLDSVIIKRPTMRTFKALSALFELCAIRQIVIDSKKQTLSNSGWQAVQEFLASARSNDVSVQFKPSNN